MCPSYIPSFLLCVYRSAGAWIISVHRPAEFQCEEQTDCDGSAMTNVGGQEAAQFLHEHGVGNRLTMILVPVEIRAWVRMG